MADVDIEMGEGDLNALIAAADAPTPDDVSISADGHRLDSADAVLEFIKSLSPSALEA